jgi:hypothetical protein
MNKFWPIFFPVETNTVIMDWKLDLFNICYVWIRTFLNLKNYFLFPQFLYDKSYFVLSMPLSVAFLNSIAIITDWSLAAIFYSSFARKLQIVLNLLAAKSFWIKLWQKLSDFFKKLREESKAPIPIVTKFII